VFLLADRNERKRGVRFMLLFAATLLPLFLFAFFFIPLFHISVLLGIQKFFSSANLKSDISMYGRYVEWRYILKPISSSFITGQGFGATYWLYGWLSGYSMESAFTHNAFFAVMLRTGIVGFILLLVP